MKRSPLQRKTELRAQASPEAAEKVFRPRCCQARLGGCGEMFIPRRQFQKACAPACAHRMIDRRKAKDDRRQTRAQLEALKTVPKLKQEAQREVNRFVRARDRLAGHGCICCGQPLTWQSGRGGAVDAGHYRSTGSADHLRFDLDNIHAQRADCNRYRAGRAVDYRLGLIARIGLARVEALESNNIPVKWTRDGLRQIRDEYRRKANELELMIKDAA